jgi:two-component system nitrate/nitrite response regulator NarL
MSGSGVVAPVSVLIVDDNASVREAVRQTLDDDRRFLVVAEATSGAEGIDVARKRQPDVVLLDLSMPDASGLDVLPGLREVASQSRIVMYTAVPSEGLADVVVALGGVGVIEKGSGPLADQLASLL